MPLLYHFVAGGERDFQEKGDYINFTYYCTELLEALPNRSHQWFTVGSHQEAARHAEVVG